MEAYYILTADIDLQGKSFLPIGYGDSETQYSPFKGTFDGKNYTISNLNITLNSNVGLFGELNLATIKNLVLENFNTEAKNNAGSLAGSAYDSTIDSITVKNVNTYVTNFQSGGGLLGYTNKTNIYNSHVDGTVLGKGDFIGGIVGYGRTTNLYKSSFVGDVSSTSNGYYDDGLCVGGLLGSGKDNIIEESFVKANISCVNGYVGGIVGQTSGYLNLSNSFVVGNLSGKTSIAGFVSTSMPNQVTNIEIENSYFVGDIDSSITSNDGALVIKSIDSNTNVINSYFDKDILSGTSQKDEGRSTIELKNKATYVGWSFNDIWNIDNDYPTLKWENENPSQPDDELKGEGTKESPYQLNVAKDFYKIEQNLKAHYIITNNIDFSNENSFVIAEANGETFSGSLNGNGYSVSGFKNNEFGYDGGLFNIINGAEIFNLILENMDVSGYSSIGILAGTAYNSNIYDITIKNSQVNGTFKIGGLFGHSQDSTIENINMEDIHVKGESYIGGVVGNSKNNLENISANNITVTGENLTGGVVGYHEYMPINNIEIIDSTINGDIHIGGIIGKAYSSQVSNLKASGINMTGKEDIGGLIGRAEVLTLSDLILETSNENNNIINGDYYTGGLVGTSINSKMNNLQSEGVNITGILQLGGLVGIAVDSDMTDSFVNTNLKDVQMNIKGDYELGGLIGLAKNTSISKSYSIINGTIEGKNDVGGIVGCSEGIDSKILIDQVYSRINSITSDYCAGGLAGIIYDTNIQNGISYTTINSPNPEKSGGLIGLSYDSGLKNSLYLGKTLTNNPLIANPLESTSIVSSYYDKNIQEISSFESYGKTTSQLKNKNTFVDWNFNEIWEIDEGKSYPNLKWLNNDITPPIDDNGLEGKGTLEEPYEISKPCDFTQIEKDMLANYIIVNNLNFDGKEFHAIGLSKKENFKGTLKGNGFIIENITIHNDDETTSLFYGLEDASISEIIFDGVTLKNLKTNSTTSLFGNAINTKFLHCIVFNLNIESESENIGGLITKGKNLTIEGVSIYGNIKSSNAIIGGIASTIENSKINTCSFVGKIESDNIVAGFFGNMIKSELNNSFSMATLSSKTRYGLAKDVYDDSTITNSYFDSILSRINTPSEQGKTSEEMLSGKLFENKGRSLILSFWAIVAIEIAISGVVIGLLYIPDWLYEKPNKELDPDMKERLDKLIDDIKDFAINEYESFEKETNIEVVIAIDSSANMNKYSRGIALEMAQKLSNELYMYSKGASNDYGDEQFEETMKIGLIDFNDSPLWFSTIAGKQKYFNNSLNSIKDFNLYYRPYIYTTMVNAAYGFQKKYSPNYSEPLTIHDDDIERHIVVLTSGTDFDKKASIGGKYAKDVVDGISLNNNIKFHFIELQEREYNGNSNLMQLAENSKGVFNKVDLKSENELEQSKSALKKISFDILGEEEKWKEPTSIRGLLLFVGHWWGTLGNSEYPEVSDDIFDSNSDLYVGAQDYIIITSNGILYNKYIDKNGVERDVLTSEDVKQLSYPELSELEEKILKNDLHLTITGEPLYNNTYSLEHDFSKFSDDYMNKLEETNSRYGSKEINTRIEIDDDEKDGLTLDELVEKEYKTLAKKILSKDPQASLWFSLPLMTTAIPLADKFIEAYQYNIIDGVKKAMEELEIELGINRIWENNTRGFYFSSENMVDYGVKYDAEDINKAFDFEFVENYEKRTIGEKIDWNSEKNGAPALDLAIATSDYVHSEEINKKLLWIPHYHAMHRTSATGKFLDDLVFSLIANETDIFDYVIIQPTTYFIDRLEDGKDGSPNRIPVDHSTICKRKY